MDILAQDDKRSQKAAATCVAAIAAVDVPDGNWNDFMEGFAHSSAQRDKESLRYAAILTLGYFSEFIQKMGRSLSQQQTLSMLHATFTNIDESNNEVTSIALDAINRIMPTIGQCFEVKEQRDYIMDGLLKAASFSDEDVQEKAL